MADDPASVASTYFEAWKANDFDTMRSLVADDVGFEGPHEPRWKAPRSTWRA